MTVERNVFSTRKKLAAALADAVAADLEAGIAERDTACLAVSGGSTPALFFETLAARDDVDWSRVVVTLVDERWVPETSRRSNAALVRKTLLQGPAQAALFVPLYTGGDAPDAASIAAANAAIKDDISFPFDAVVLGMGNDGHTASFFPGGDTLAEALGGEGPVVSMRAPGAGEPRATFTLPALLATRGLYLHIEGEEKAMVLEQALSTGAVEDMPVRAVLSQDQRPVSLYWCP